jgi:DNA-binding response OmpR family regulator
MNNSIGPRILIVDDDNELSTAISWFLEAEGMRPLHANSGTEAIEKFHREKPDAIILDIMMPGLDGFQVCSLIRKESNIPILILSAREAEMDKVRALNIGADDYVTKPFSAMEFIARIKALLRRTSTSPTEHLIYRGLKLSIEQHSVTFNGHVVHLSALEFELLLVMMKRPNIVMGRTQLADYVWKDDFSGDIRLVDTHIYHLRDKLTEAGMFPCPISTIRGVGYAFHTED